MTGQLNPVLWQPINMKERLILQLPLLLSALARPQVADGSFYHNDQADEALKNDQISTIDKFASMAYENLN